MDQDFITNEDVQSANVEILSSEEDKKNWTNNFTMFLAVIVIVGIFILIYQHLKMKDEKEITVTDENGNEKTINLNVTIDDVHEALEELSNLPDEDIQPSLY